MHNLEISKIYSIDVSLSFSIYRISYISVKKNLVIIVRRKQEKSCVVLKVDVIGLLPALLESKTQKINKLNLFKN
jgi:hypothetical protein